MNKKLIALVLGAVITSGIGGFGTYAYFTDREAASESVSITMGTVDASVNWIGSGWTPFTNGTEAIEMMTDDFGFTNVKPGDEFYREIEVVNTGSLKADTIVELNANLGAELNVDFQVMHEDKTWDENFYGKDNRFEKLAVAPGEKLVVRVHVRIPKEMTNFEGKEFNFDAQEFVVVNMHQTIR